MHSEIAVGSVSRSPPDFLSRPDADGRDAGLLAVCRRLSARAGSFWAALPLAWRLSATAVLGAAGAAAVGYATAQNSAASPAHVAVLVRVLIVVLLIGAGLYAQTSKIQARMGGLLVAAGIYASVWLLNGSSDSFLFSVGELAAGAGPVILAFLMLAHPTGQLRSDSERRFLLYTGAPLFALWIVGSTIAAQPPLRTSLLACAPHCPPNVFAFGSATTASTAVRLPMILAYIALTCGTPWFVARRSSASAEPLRRSITPVLIVSIATAVALLLYLASVAAGLDPAAVHGGYLAVAVATPLAILAGLGSERQFMGRTLADFVNRLAEDPYADPQRLISAALDDPSLTIAYRRLGRTAYVDSAGLPVLEAPEDRAITLIERDGDPVAAISYDPELASQERFVQAAGAASMMRLERSQFEAELKASMEDLRASRVRLVEEAHAERRRIERDLHDGVQQQLIGMRIKLELATEIIKDDPTEGERALVAVGAEMDDALEAVRSLGRGIYPPLLRDAGLKEALKSAARSSPLPVTVRAPGLGRYTEDVEVAVYFCCLEALQNAAKHGGPGASATISLWSRGERLCFEVRDTGAGCDLDRASPGHGLINMRDRIQTVGGTVTFASRPGRGTAVRGTVPAG